MCLLVLTQEEVVMKRNEVRVTIKNMETGEESSGEYYLFFEGLKLNMTTIVKITHVDSYVDPDSNLKA